MVDIEKAMYHSRPYQVTIENRSKSKNETKFETEKIFIYFANAKQPEPNEKYFFSVGSLFLTVIPTNHMIKLHNLDHSETKKNRLFLIA